MQKPPGLRQLPCSSARLRTQTCASGHKRVQIEQATGGRAVPPYLSRFRRHTTGAVAVPTPFSSSLPPFTGLHAWVRAPRSERNPHNQNARMQICDTSDPGRRNGGAVDLWPTWPGSGHRLDTPDTPRAGGRGLQPAGPLAFFAALLASTCSGDVVHVCVSGHSSAASCFRAV